MRQTILLFFNKSVGPTLDGYKDIGSGWIANTIISSTSVDSFVLCTSNCQRKGDNAVIINFCPGDVWCWITISCTVEVYYISLKHILVTRNVSDIWCNCKLIEATEMFEMIL